MDGSILLIDRLRNAPTSPAFPPGPYRFVDRQYLIIKYRTDPAALRGWCQSRSRLSSPW
jgi:acetoacetate decarboxylase